MLMISDQGTVIPWSTCTLQKEVVLEALKHIEKPDWVYIRCYWKQERRLLESW